MKPFAIAQTAAILVAAHQGLGKPANYLSSEQIAHVDKAGSDASKRDSSDS